MANHKSGNDDFEYSGTAPSDVVYEQEAPVRSARYSVATLATTSVLVAVGLVGGAAFALSATLPAKQSSGSVQVTDGSGAATASTDASPIPSPSSSATAGDDDSGHKLSGKTIAIPPAAFDDKDGGRDFHPAPQAGGTGSTAAPSAAPSAPYFGGGKGDREGDHHKPRPGITPAPGASAAPNFGGGSDDEGEDD